MTLDERLKSQKFTSDDIKDGFDVHEAVVGLIKYFGLVEDVRIHETSSIEVKTLRGYKMRYHLVLGLVEDGLVEEDDEE